MALMSVGYIIPQKVGSYLSRKRRRVSFKPLMRCRLSEDLADICHLEG